MQSPISTLLFLPVTIHFQTAHAKLLQKEIPENCKYFTVGGCNPATNEIIDTYDIPNAENAVSLCQQVCQIQEGCNFFSYNNAVEQCTLFHYSYLDSCQLIGGSDVPTIDECTPDDLDNTCFSFVKEDCEYQGTAVFHKASVTDTHSCQEILVELGAVLKGVYFVYDSETHICTFFDSREFTCSTVSGPALPNYEECSNTSAPPTAATTTAGTTEETTTAATTPAGTTEATTTAATTASGCSTDEDCLMPGEHCDPSDGKCYECLSNADCSSGELPICSNAGICVECERTEDCGTAGVCDESTNMCGCREQEDCPGYNAICDETFSNCNYCNATENVDFGSCISGCKTNENCVEPLECNGEHQCKEPPSFLSLKQIIFNTASCEGCQGTNQEDGPILHIIGGEGVGGIPECYTNPLDHEEQVDFATGTQAVFDQENDKDVLGQCDKADLLGEVTGGSIEWTSQTGSWSLVGDQVDFTWSSDNQCKYSCCLGNPMLSPDAPIAELVKCMPNCGDDLVC